MSQNSQTITVNIEDAKHDKQLQRQRQLERNVVERLAEERIFLVRQQGNQTFYYDTLLEGKEIAFQHVLEISIYECRQVDPSYDAGDLLSSNNPLRQLLKATYFRPIKLEKRYRPHEPAAVFDRGTYYLNSWRQPEVKPTHFGSLKAAREGAKPFVQHLQLMLDDKQLSLDSPDSKAGYLIRMLAYRYQVHDFLVKQKPHVAFYFYGLQGSGKSLLSTTLEQVFGKSAVMSVPDETSLNSMSSVDMFSRTWCFIDEVNISKGSTNYNSIKTATGSTTTDAARKNEHFQHHYIPAQLFMFSQQPPTFIEAGDRRFFISTWQYEFNSQAEKDDYFRGYINWLHDKGGFSAIAGLLAATDISSVRPESPAMITSEKLQVVEMVTDSAVQDIASLLADNPEQVCWTENDFDLVWIEHGTKPNQIGYKLQQAGLVVQKKDKYEGRRWLQFYLRKGYTIERKKQVGTTLIDSTTGQRKDIREDGGYSDAMTRPAKTV